MSQFTQFTISNTTISSLYIHHTQKVLASTIVILRGMILIEKLLNWRFGHLFHATFRIMTTELSRIRIFWHVTQYPSFVVRVEWSKEILLGSIYVPSKGRETQTQRHNITYNMICILVFFPLCIRIISIYITGRYILLIRNWSLLVLAVLKGLVWFSEQPQRKTNFIRH